MGKNVYFVYRSYYDGPLSKRIVRLRGSSVIEYFQIVWKEAALANDPYKWVKQEFDGDVYGLESISEAIQRFKLSTPQTWTELTELLERYLYIEGDFRQSEETVQIRTDDDEVELAYYFFSEDYAQEHQDRTAYLLQDYWHLPQGYTTEPYEPPIVVDTLQPINGDDEGETYVLYFAPYATTSFDVIKPWAIKGVRLPTLHNYLRTIEPEAIIHKRYNIIDGWHDWNEYWPLELLLLRAMVKEQDKSIEPALYRCNFYPVDHLVTSMRGTGLGTQKQARNEFKEFEEYAAKKFRPSGNNPKQSLIAVSPHIAQVCLHANDWCGYHQWFLFDDMWAAANPQLADSLLRYAAHWDPFMEEDVSNQRTA